MIDARRIGLDIARTASDMVTVRAREQADKDAAETDGLDGARRWLDDYGLSWPDTPPERGENRAAGPHPA